MPILSTIESVDRLQGLALADGGKYGPWEARIWPTPTGDLAPNAYPEIALGLEDADGVPLSDRPNFGLCFSGGGSRASTTGFGIMRAMMRLSGEIAPQQTAPFIDRIRYTSGVSGGNWFLKAFTFCPGSVPEFGADSFFGSHAAPEPVLINDQMSDADIISAREEEVARICHQLLDIQSGNPFPALAVQSDDALFLRGSANNSQWAWWIWDGITSEVSDYLNLQGIVGDPDDLQITRSDEAWNRMTCGPICEALGLYGWQNGVDVSNRFFTWNDVTLSIKPPPISFPACALPI